MNLNNYKEILQLTEFRKLWIAQILRAFGNSLYFISLMWIIWENTNSTLHSGLFAILYDIPQLLLGLWIGVVISRFNLRNVMVFSDIVRGIGVTLVIICYFLDTLSVTIVYMAIFLEGLMLVINRPASNSIVPLIVPKEKLEPANATFQLSNRIINVAGYGISGVIISTIGAILSIIYNAISFFLSALLVRKIKVNSTINKKNNSLSKDIKEGFLYLKNEPALIIIFSIGILMNVGGAPISVLGPAYSEEVINAGAIGYGLIQAMWLIGISLGAFIIGNIKKVDKLWIPLSVGFGMQGMAQLLFGLSSHVLFSSFFILLHGFFMSVANIPLFSFVQRYVPVDKLPHVFSILGTLVMVANPLAFGATGYLADTIGIRFSYIIGSLLHIIAALLIVIPPWLRNTENTSKKETIDI